jgi:hypothetical protein
MIERNILRNQLPKQYYSDSDDFNKMAKEDQEIYLYLRDVFAGK